jgi:hypothetical protein
MGGRSYATANQELDGRQFGSQHPHQLHVDTSGPANARYVDHQNCRDARLGCESAELEWGEPP